MVSAASIADPGGLPFVASPSGHTLCEIQAPGTLRCWGDNTLGTAGRGTAMGPDVDPTSILAWYSAPDVSLFTDARGVDVDGHNGCAIVHATGELWCWGANDHGQLALGSIDPNAHPTPVAVMGL